MLVYKGARSKIIHCSTGSTFSKSPS